MGSAKRWRWEAFPRFPGSPDYRSELCMRKSTVGGIKLKVTGWIGLKLTDKELPELTYLGDKAVPL